MRYIELLGLPGSGKTTLLRSFRGRSLGGKSVRTVLSEDWAMGLRRFGYREIGFFRWLEKIQPRMSSAEVIRNLTLDYWQMGIFSQYPNLFSHIFLCLETVVPEDRQREILLNYWRSRISLYMDVSQSAGPSLCVVDEGLSQSVFSTMRRMSAPSERKLELVDAVLRCLPLDRHVVMIRTPRELIEMRAQANAKHLAYDLSLKIEEIDFIFQQQEKHGQATFELDGSLSAEKLLAGLNSYINSLDKRKSL